MPIKNQQQLLTIIAIAVVGLFAADQVIYTPLSKAWKSRSDHIAKLRQDVARGKRLRQREVSIRNYWRDISERTLTNDQFAAELQVNQAIDRWALNAGVALGGITPQWKDNDGFSTCEWHVDAAGDLGRITRFLYSAEREPLAFKLQSVELRSSDKEGRQIALNLQLSGLMLNTPEK